MSGKFIGCDLPRGTVAHVIIIIVNPTHLHPTCEKIRLCRFHRELVSYRCRAEVVRGGVGGGGAVSGGLTATTGRTCNDVVTSCGRRFAEVEVRDGGGGGTTAGIAAVIGRSGSDLVFTRCGADVEV